MFCLCCIRSVQLHVGQRQLILDIFVYRDECFVFVSMPDEAFIVLDLCKVIRSIASLERSIARNCIHVLNEVAKIVVAFVFVEILLMTRMPWGPSQARIRIINCVPKTVDDKHISDNRDGGNDCFVVGEGLWTLAKLICSTPEDRQSIASRSGWKYFKCAPKTGG